MGEITRITRRRREEFINERWALTDPNTPILHKGIIARIFRRKEGKRRYTIFRRKRKTA